MLILKDYGKSENDLGVWFPFGDAEPAPFEVRVRRIPYSEAQKISKRYGRETMTVVDGIRRPQIERSLEDTTKWILDQAAWAWVDARGLKLEVADDEAARLWSGLIKNDVKVGEVIELSGALLTHEAKLRILTQLRPFAVIIDAETQKRERHDLGTFLVLKASQIQQDAQKADEEALGNS